MLFEFFMNFLNIEKTYFFQYFMFSSRFMLLTFKKIVVYKNCVDNLKKKILSHFILHYAIFNIKKN